ncbi:polysaccharide deacetylase family protein [candidate division KSB1 bacterium]|nr:polysaccharide deacetylase family protein [candidate division KSB1 bacterium]
MKYSFGQQALYELRTMLFGYPGFVYAPKASQLVGELPVFVFHSIEPAQFEQQLTYLAENGYQTLSVNEFVQCLQGKRKAAPRSVLLTIDDGRSSVWRYGYPLLKKYGLKATVFVIPGRTLETEQVRPNLESVWQNTTSKQDLHRLDPEDADLCTWPEIRQMHASALIDIESHTLFHREVFVSPQVVDFVDQNTMFTPYNSPVTPYLQIDDVGNDVKLDDYFGFPLFDASPLMAGQPALKVSDELLATCRNAYEQKNGDAAWKDMLREKVERYFEKQQSVFQKNGEVENSLCEDLMLAKELIQQKVSPEAGQHLCLPYTVGSDAAVAAAQKADMQSCFWGTIPGQRSNRRGSDPFRIMRIKNDFIWRLPGKNRKSLLGIYGLKVKRRLSKEQVY